MLSYGCKFISAIVSDIKAQPIQRSCYIAENTLTALGAPDGFIPGIKAMRSGASRSNAYQIGPILGIMVRSNPVSSEPADNQSLLCKGFISTARRLGCIMITFSPEDIDLSSGYISGVTLNNDDHWQKVQVPFIEGVFDRYLSTPGQEQVTQNFRYRLKDMGVKFYNPPEFTVISENKLEVFTRLACDPYLQFNIPRTWSLGLENLETALLEGGRDGIIVKPNYGTQGRGIIFVEADMKIKYQNGTEEPSVIQCNDVEDLCSTISRIGNGCVQLIQTRLKPGIYKGIIQFMNFLPFRN
jgi:hypothetical protein